MVLFNRSRSRSLSKQNSHREFQRVNWMALGEHFGLILIGPFHGLLCGLLNHLIPQRIKNSNRPFGTLPIGIVLSNLDTAYLETSAMISCGHF